MTARGCEKTGTVPSVARANPLLAALTSAAPWTVPSFLTAPNGAVQTRPSSPAPKAAFSRGSGSSQADASGSEFGVGALAALGGMIESFGMGQRTLPGAALSFAWGRLSDGRGCRDGVWAGNRLPSGRGSVVAGPERLRLSGGSSCRKGLLGNVRTWVTRSQRFNRSGFAPKEQNPRTPKPRSALVCPAWAESSWLKGADRELMEVTVGNRKA